MKNRLIACALFFFCTLHYSTVFGASGWVNDFITKMSALGGWGAVKELPVQVVNEKRAEIVTTVSNVIQDSVYQAYPIIKQQVIDYVYQQISYVKEQAKFGAMIGLGITGIGLTIYVIYKIYDKYKRHEITKEQTEQTIADVIYDLIMDALMYPTYTTKIHGALKQEFPNFLDDTDVIVSDACNQVIARIKRDRDRAMQENKEKAQEVEVRDEAIDKAINKITNEAISEIMRRQVSLPSSEQKLKYIIDKYITVGDKLNILLIKCIETWTIEALGTPLIKESFDTLNKDIRCFQEFLLSRLTIEERAAYSLYLRLKNKVAVEKLLSPEQKTARDPFELHGNIYRKPKPIIPQKSVDNPKQQSNSSSSLLSSSSTVITQ